MLWRQKQHKVPKGKNTELKSKRNLLTGKSELPHITGPLRYMTNINKKYVGNMRNQDD